MPSSAWDDYFAALETYLESVRVATATGRLAPVPARLASRPSGPLPASHAARQLDAVKALNDMIALAEQQRDHVADRLRFLRRRDRPTTRRSRLVDCEL
jgi:hypothetical protein